MSRQTWTLIKNSNRFYVNTYRRTGTMLVYSVLFNLLMMIAIYYLYFGQPGHDFYATNGITPPIELTPLDEPNYTSVPLLASDQENTNEYKVIPQ